MALCSLWREGKKRPRGSLDTQRHRSHQDGDLGEIQLNHMEKKSTQEKIAPTSRPRVLRGTVVSTKMKDTVVVKVERFEKMPKYEKYIKISKKYKAHDAGNTKKEGEIIDIVECAPISKDKHFKIVA